MAHTEQHRKINFMEFKDYYKCLGVIKTATQDEIRRAFRKLAKKFHPDVAKDKKTAEAKFKEINEAYEVLGDAEKRKKYDQLGSSWDQPQGGFPGGGYSAGFPQGRGRRTQGGMEYHFEGTGFSDFFEQFFGGAGGNPYAAGSDGQGFQQRRTVSAQGEDIEAEILVTLEESLRGSERSVSLRKSDASGVGGQLHTLKIRIPAGVREGQRIRLSGQGEPGSGQGQAGDLYLKIKFARHPHYRVKDQDLFYDVDLAPWEAVLGTKVNVTTLDGENVSVIVPAGVQQGTQLRLRGKGLPDSKKERQDLFLKLNIEIPETLTDKERKLWQELAQLAEP
jgi:curved DNA-binding protein